MPIFTGYHGYGTAMVNGAPLEPTDAGYSRIPVTFSDLSAFGPSSNVAGGTIGPAVASWGTLAFGGLYDAMTGGDLIAWWPLVMGTNVAAGQNYNLAPGGLKLTLNNASGVLGSGSASFAAGAVIGRMGAAQTLTAGMPLVVTGNALVASTAGQTAVTTIAASGAALTILAGSSTQTRVLDVTMSAACALAVGAAGGVPYQKVELYIRQPASGGFAVTWPASVIWTSGTAPTVPTTAGSEWRYVFATDDAGAHWMGDL